MIRAVLSYKGWSEGDVLGVEEKILLREGLGILKDEELADLLAEKKARRGKKERVECWAAKAAALSKLFS